MTLPTDVFGDIIRVLSTIQTRSLTPTHACDECGFPYSTFDHYTRTVPQLATMRKEAEDRLYDTLADLLVRIDAHPEHGRSDPKMAAVISKNIQWVLARRRQASYGDKIVNEHVIKADREVISALQAAKARAHGVRQLEGTVASPQPALQAVQALVMDATGVLRPETDAERLERELAELA